MATATMTKSKDSRVGYYILRSGKSPRSLPEYRSRCWRDKVPEVIIRYHRGVAWVEVELDRAGYPCLVDATTCVKLHAVYRSPLSDDVLSGRERYSTWEFLAGKVKTADPDAVGREVAAIIQEGLLYVAQWKDEPDARSKREPDWTALADYFAARVQDDPTATAIRKGYFLYRGVNDSDYFDYKTHCALAGRPVIRCKVQRGRGTLWFDQNHRTMSVLPEDVADRVRSLCMGLAGSGAIKPMHVGVGKDGGIIMGIPGEVAERVAFELFEMARAVAGE